MTTLLTDGKKTLAPDWIEIRPAPTAAPKHRTLEEHRLYGPVRERLPAAGGVLWWGEFEVGDRLTLTVYSSPGAPFRVRLLDLDYRVLGESVVTQNRIELSAPVPRSGPVYFHLIQDEAKPRPVFLQVACLRQGDFVPHAPERRSWISSTVTRLARLARPLWSSRRKTGRYALS